MAQITITLALPGWTTIVIGQDYLHEAESVPVQIKTNSVVGSGEGLNLFFFASEKASGGVMVKFFDPPTYFVSYCSSGYTLFPVALPEEVDKIWTITQTAKTVKISCNEVELVTYTFANNNNGNCIPFWSRDTVKIKFHGTYDSQASDQFRAKPGRLEIPL